MIKAKYLNEAIKNKNATGIMQCIFPDCIVSGWIKQSLYALELECIDHNCSTNSKTYSNRSYQALIPQCYKH